MLRYTKIAIAGVVLAATGIATYAATRMENDAASLPATKISLSQAVAAAEQQTNGRATRAELEHTKSGIVFDVEVVSGAKVFDVRVDADKGTVISSAEDKADHENDDDHDKKD
ncbi:PepSY domain-containing protein [Polaromonas sp.]|uniref:PepSY domain-containing protein n=1 Tax=Polaromonas sp. TaxID=1869339 RepID=UPI0013BA91D0|nr:PepSY domain-containing protein [Polaromonas sp.]NDP63527.1 peptidase M4 [Polaromonas sp.]